MTTKLFDPVAVAEGDGLIVAEMTVGVPWTVMLHEVISGFDPDGMRLGVMTVVEVDEGPPTNVYVAVAEVARMGPPGF